MPNRLLIIEDDPDIRQLLKYNLQKEGYAVRCASDGAEGLALARAEHPDLVLLDLMLPTMGGIEVCLQLRRDSQVPILMLTARQEEVDRVLGLEVGADDYLTKPFSVRELLGRIKAILRRAQPREPGEAVRRAGQLAVDFARYTVTLRGRPVPLSTKEFAFLKALLEARGKACTRDQLLEQVWGYDRSLEIDTRTIDQHIARLREKLGAEAHRIVTIKNVGYRFDLA